MSDQSGRRCPNCDTFVPAGSNRCLMCGTVLPSLPVISPPEMPTVSPPAVPEPEAVQEAEPRPAVEEEGGSTPMLLAETAAAEPLPIAPPEPETIPIAETIIEPQPAATPPLPQATRPPISIRTLIAQQRRQPADVPISDLQSPAPIFESVMRERQSRLTFWLTAVFAVLITLVAVFMLQNPIEATAILFPTLTPIPPTATYTPTWTPPPTETSPPTDTPTITPTPLPTDTPQPPRFHTVSSGETLFGLSLRYRITAGSIAEANGITLDSAINVSQQLQIPWPTATPPLVPVEVQVGGDTVIADPTDCRRYTIQDGDSLFAVAARERIDLNALLLVNRLNDQSIVQPGDDICIPTIIVGGILPPTPGPSPTPTPTSAPPGPQLLYPAREALVDPPDGTLLLQWVAVKDLTDNEWYMVELTDLTDLDSHPRRGFTRDNAFRVPGDWRPDEPADHRFRWRVSIVQVTGRREDGGFIYTFGGRNSEDAYFTWLGAIPTPTPTPTLTPTPTPEP